MCVCTHMCKFLCVAMGMVLFTLERLLISNKLGTSPQCNAGKTFLERCHSYLLTMTAKTTISHGQRIFDYKWNPFSVACAVKMSEEQGRKQ